MNRLKPVLIYLKTFLFSLMFDWLLLVFICNYLGFDRKSATCVYLYGIGGFILKGIIFFLPILFISQNSILNSKTKRAFLFLSPFFIFLTWFVIIILFQIESLYTELSFGYIYHFPHFYIQLFASLVIPLIILLITNKKLKSINQTSKAIISNTNI